jgi:hypothetical protein
VPILIREFGVFIFEDSVQHIDNEKTVVVGKISL